MGFDLNRTLISDGVSFTAIKSGKFKSNRISVNLFAPLCEETAAAYAVLPLILRRSCREYPDAGAFCRLLNSLYGAYVDYDVKKIGDSQLISLSITAIDDRYTLNKECISAEISKLLCCMLLDPVIEDGAFCRKTFETEKQSLIDNIKAELNDKVSLASTRCQQIMCAGQPFAVNCLGSLESAQALTCRSAFDAYNELLKKARIEIMFTGSGCPDAALDIFSSSFNSCVQRDKPFDIHSEKTCFSGEVKNVDEPFSVSQAKLSMGFVCDSSVGDSDECAMSFMSALFGSTPFSKLFVNVREKLSLCYYCSASYDRFKGIILVNSGIEANNRVNAQQEIINQLNSLKNGEITDEEFNNTKKLLSNILTGVCDTIRSAEAFYLSRLVCGKTSNPEAEIADINALTKDEIVSAAKKVTLDTVYFMEPKEEAR